MRVRVTIEYLDSSPSGEHPEPTVLDLEECRISQNRDIYAVVPEVGMSYKIRELVPSPRSYVRLSGVTVPDPEALRSFNERLPDLVLCKGTT